MLARIRHTALAALIVAWVLMVMMFGPLVGMITIIVVDWWQGKEGDPTQENRMRKKCGLLPNLVTA